MSVENNVPEIRFNGFSGEWEEYPLSTFINSMDAGVSVNSGDRPANESEFGILKTSCVTNGFFEPNENKIVFKAEEINRLKEPVSQNTIIISRMNTPALVGANAYIGKSFANYFLPDRLWAAKPTSVGDLKFIAYILGSDKGRLALSELATGTSGSMKNISKTSVLRLKFRAPLDQEQTQIGNTFQKLDNLINQHQQKHDKLNSIKNAMLGKMFPKQGETTPEIRFKGFSGEWEEIELSDEVTFINGRAYSQEELLDKGKYIVLRVGNFYTNSSWYYSDLELGDKYYADNGDLLYTWSASFGPHIWNGGKVIYHYHIWKLELSESVDKLFLLHLLDYDRAKILSGSNGSTMIHITKSAMEAKKVFIPKKDEQIVIGNYFQKLDALINQHQQQITKLNNIKQACLSKMFV